MMKLFIFLLFIQIINYSDGFILNNKENKSINPDTDEKTFLQLYNDSKSLNKSKDKSDTYNKSLNSDNENKINRKSFFSFNGKDSKTANLDKELKRNLKSKTISKSINRDKKRKKIPKIDTDSKSVKHFPSFNQTNRKSVNQDKKITVSSVSDRSTKLINLNKNDKESSPLSTRESRFLEQSMKVALPKKNIKSIKKSRQNDDLSKPEKGRFHFVVFLLLGLILTIIGYAVFQKRKKILGYFIEGKRSSRRLRSSGSKESNIPYSQLRTEDKEAGVKYVH